MIKIQPLFAIFLCCFLLLSCNEKKKADNTNEEFNTKIHKEELNVVQLMETKEQLGLLTLDKAIALFGEPVGKEFMIIKEGHIPLELKELIKKHFPTKEYITSKVEVLEASWQLQDQSWIQVWYKLENKVWIPIDVLLTV